MPLPGIFQSLSRPTPAVFGQAPLGAPTDPANTIQPVDVPTIAPQQGGILGRLKAGLADDGVREGLFRAGAAMLAGGGAGQGAMAFADSMDRRRQEQRQDARFQQDFGLRKRGVDVQDRTADANIRQGDRRLDQVDRANDIDEQYKAAQTDLANRGLQEQIEARKEGNSIKLYDINTGKEVSMAQMANQRGIAAAGNASAERIAAGNNATSARNADVGAAATIEAAGARYGGRPDPRRARGVLDAVLPSVMPQGADASDWTKAIQSSPDAYGQLMDSAYPAYMSGGVQGAQAAAKGVLDRFDYKGGGWFDGSPRMVARADGSDRAASPQGIPPGAIDMLRKNPSLAPQFDAKYGQGASAKLIGK